jgi:hypothetical protein
MPKFRPGVSGNVKGRPRGVPDRRAPLRELIAKQAPELIRLAVDAAKAGDTTALGLLLARCVAPLRPASDPISFDMAPGASLADQARSILAAIADGRIDPHTGRALVDAVAAVGRVVELDEIERRLTALESGEPDDET